MARFHLIQSIYIPALLCERLIHLLLDIATTPLNNDDSIFNN